MNLLAWLLSLVIEWVRPLEPSDPALVPDAASSADDDDGTIDTMIAAGGETAASTSAPSAATSPPGESGDRTDPATPASPAAAAEPTDDAAPHDPVGSGLSRSNPLWTLGDRLLELVAPSAASPPGWAGWALMLLVPAIVVWVLQGLLETLGGIGSLLLLALHAVVLYLTVPMGRLVRRLDRLGLLAAAGEKAAMREMVSRWSLDDRRGAVATHASGAAPRAVTPLKGSLSGSLVAARSTFALPILDAYRDVFAPLFWYVLLGPAAPVAYGFARLTAERRTGVARRALCWIDWIPSRLAAASLAFGGRFDDAMLGLRAGHDASRAGRAEAPEKRRPVRALQLLLLPAAGGALGIRVTDPAVEAALRDASPDHDPPDAAPTPAGYPALRALLGRTAMIWGGLWLLVHLVG